MRHRLPCLSPELSHDDVNHLAYLPRPHHIGTRSSPRRACWDRPNYASLVSVGAPHTLPAWRALGYGLSSLDPSWRRRIMPPRKKIVEIEIRQGARIAAATRGGAIFRRAAMPASAKIGGALGTCGNVPLARRGAASPPRITPTALTAPIMSQANRSSSPHGTIPRTHMTAKASHAPPIPQYARWLRSLTGSVKRRQMVHGTH
jgi:hypothetical protein